MDKISPRWLKIIRDLWTSKQRTLLVILSIAIGVAAIGIVAGTRIIIGRDLPSSYKAINPADATISCAPFNDDFLRVIRSVEGVKDAEARRTVNVRVKVGPEEWKDLTLMAVPDYGKMSINKIKPESGSWPPPSREVLIERASLSLTNANVGDSIEIQTAQGKVRTTRIAGLVHDISQPSGPFFNQISGYITFDTLEWLGYSTDYTEMVVTTNLSSPTKAAITEVIYRVRDRIERSGREILWITIPEPGQHWFEPFMAPMTAILATLGILALLLSCFLVINIISALLAQQIRQVGVMKAIGARGYQIVQMYLVSVLIIGLISMVISLPLSQLGLRATVGLLTSYINFDIVNSGLPQQVILLQVAMSLLVPMFAALFPILSGTKVTVREAINDYGISKDSGKPGLFDRVLTYVRGLPRPTLLSIRNTFRRKGRLILTLVTLSLSSAIFISVIGVYDSLNRTLDNALQYYGFDIAVFFTRPYRIEQIQAEISRVPGINAAETWGLADSRRIRPDNTESDSIMLVAPPTGTQLIHPVLLEGRWLLPDDENAVVVNSDVLRYDPDIKVNDEIVLKVDGEKTSWKVVGVIQSVLVGPWAYTNYPYFAYRFNRTGTASAVYVVTNQHDTNFQATTAKAIENHFDQVGMHVSSVSKINDLREATISQFNVLVAFLLIMAIILAIVGGLGLTGTMSLNVLERTREIGVMRAIGASTGAILQIFITEGVLIGLLSWAIGTILAVPLSQAMSNLVGMSFLQTALDYSYSTQGALIWLGIVIVLSMAASLLPAINATRVTVRDVLAYE